MPRKRQAAPAVDVARVLKILGNEARLNIMEWLRDPPRHFGEQPVGTFEDDGVCVTLIQQKVGLTQSTVSAYLAQLQQAGLLSAKRVGQWTYYRRNEPAIEALLADLRERL
ncbi:MAG: helix-turn-helix transcriptional regulator [Piscinibacter sp.]|nr:helix-turn-helix transcriptional regulator [Piscinibacter sp.]